MSRSFVSRHLAIALLALAGCGQEIGELPGVGSPDSGGLPVADAAVVADASELADAAPDEPDAESDAAVEEPEGTPATVTAPCLFLRMGPGTDQPKVPCVAGGLECNADNDVCIPMGDIFNVTGTPKTGAGCPQWYPGTYKTYEGYTCGDYLEIPAASQLGVSKSPTLYPSLTAGPQG